MATSVATTVEIGCPHCGAAIPSPDGSEFWTVHEYRTAANGEPRECNACDEPFRILLHTRVGLQ